MRVLDLFSGIGGFSLGLERSGDFETVAFCECEPYCRAVLKKHWLGVPCYDDIRTLTADRLAADGIGVDLICGGFPCQDISAAGLGAGLAGARSGLWREYLRLIRELRPRWVIVENVSALLARGLGEVLGNLASIGYDAEWHCIPAASVGAPHRRDRVWIIAYPCDAKWRQEHQARRTDRAQLLCERQEGSIGSGGRREAMADTDGSWELQPQGPLIPVWRWLDDSGSLGDAERPGLEGHGADPGQPQEPALGDAGWWEFEPDVGRVAHGVPARVDRLRALGNAIVPQVVEVIGRAIMASQSAP